MNISNFLVVALLATAAGATDPNKVSYNPVTGTSVKPENPQTNVPEKSGGTQESAKGGSPTSAIKLSGVTGEVKIKTAGGTMTVKAGEPVPEIPSGAEIIVVSGDASVAVGGAIIKAGAGDSFTITTSGAGGATISVTGGVITVVDASGKSADFAKGELTTISTTAPAAKPVTAATQTKTETPESIPDDSDATTPFAPSPSQENATTNNSTTNNSTCVATVSPSSPCP